MASILIIDDDGPLRGLLRTTLEEAGYVSSAKDGRGRGGSTTYAMTKEGRRAYQAHCAALRTLIDAAEPTPTAR